MATATPAVSRISTATSPTTGAAKAVAEPIRLCKSKKRQSLSFKEEGFKPISSPKKKLISTDGRGIPSPPLLDLNAVSSQTDADRGNGKISKGAGSVDNTLSCREQETQKSGGACKAKTKHGSTRSTRLSAKAVLGTRSSPRPKPLEIYVGKKVKDANHAGNTIMVEMMKKDSELLREFEMDKASSHQSKEEAAAGFLDRVVEKHPNVQFFYLDGYNKASGKYLMTELALEDSCLRTCVVLKLEELAKKSIKSRSPTKTKKKYAKGKLTTSTASNTAKPASKRKGGVKKVPEQKGNEKKGPSKASSVNTQSRGGTAQREKKEKEKAPSKTNSVKIQESSKSSNKGQPTELPLVPFVYSKSDESRIEKLKTLKKGDLDIAFTLIKIPPFPPATNASPKNTNTSELAVKKGEDVGLGSLSRKMSGLSLMEDCDGMEDGDERSENLAVLAEFLGEAGFGPGLPSQQQLEQQQEDLNLDDFTACSFSSGDSIRRDNIDQQHQHQREQLDPNYIDFTFSTGDAKLSQGNVDQKSQFPTTKLSRSSSSGCSNFSSVSFPNASFGSLDGAIHLGVW